MRLRTGFIYTLILSLALPAFASEPLTFTEVLRRAESRVRQASARVNIARANLKYMETQSKIKWELRPQLALFSFTNPLLLATSLGLGLLGNRSQAPSPFSWQAARFEELQAEVAEHQALIDAQAHAGRLFFDVLQKQQAHEQLAELAGSRRRVIQTFERGAGRTQMTAVTRARIENASLDLESQLSEASDAYESASIQLAAFLDLDAAEAVAPLRVVDPEQIGGENTSVPAAETLLLLALQRRPDLQTIHARLTALEKQVPRNSRFQMDGLSFGFNRVTDTGSNAAGLGGGAGYLLGGNTSRSDFGFRLRLRDNGEDQALADVVAAQIHLLRVEVETVEHSLNWEVKSLRATAVAGLEQARLTARKLESAETLAHAIELRQRSGLESAEAALAAETEVLRIRAQYRGAQAERNARLYHLLAVCGLGADNAAQWKSVLGM